MTFSGFSKEDFNTFSIPGLEGRMEAIQTRIQPKFKQIGNELVDYLAVQTGNEMHLHIAKHARRTVNPPNDTWLAIADNKRGYKKHPHFQVGLFDDHVFIWLALIYELDFKREIAEAFMDSFEELKALPASFVISLDHMKKAAIPLEELEMDHLEHFRNVKKAEFLIGQHFSPEDSIVTNGAKFMENAKQTIDPLIPFYHKALQARKTL
ncbi:YktB family protein [Virgibacillus sp. MG-45]|uniref:YktB family protein n=1 Tax=Virgibacillus sp. MG-45 TaxID=3102791 RepID=UPI002ED7DCD8